MLNNPRKQRLMREAIGNADGETPVAVGDVWAIAVAILFIVFAIAFSGY